ncbi:Hypothetical protein R9X50_00127900 [Acrodontium crateriforme]|uniref:Fe2OG dioxygenase domain-containing protein n=1 Tax=Acrodontium crateriforme TaxID=150365 RepID=A0AAQ3LYV1_9PEZI|nr:Hypothetical protein R9X50_00127900 [Acrodontium crateriforme]
MSPIPTINIRAYIDPSASIEEKAEVISKLEAACSHYGFLQISGHGVPISTQRAALEASKLLFSLSQEDKDKLSLKSNPARRGYERIGEQILDSKSLPDNKEGYYLGREVPLEHTGFLRGPNQWPDLPEELFRRPLENYYQHMDKLGKNLLEMLAIGLGHDISVLDTFTREPVMNLKLLHYPPHISKNDRQFGAGEHTDFGAITMLMQQPGKDGLEVYYEPMKGWLSVSAVEDVFVINMGDLIHKWSNGRYKSTLHRVVNKSGDERYSIPCFYQGDLAATNPFKPGEDGGETVEQHIRGRFDESYGIKTRS